MFCLRDPLTVERDRSMVLFSFLDKCKHCFSYRVLLPVLLKWFWDNVWQKSECWSLKYGISVQIKNIHIHWYFIATKYLIWNNAFVGYIDIWTRVYSLVTIYLNNQNNSYRVSRKRVWYLWAIWKYNYQWCGGFFLPHSPQIPLKKAFIYNICMLIS